MILVGGQGVLAELGEMEGSAITVKKGRFGAYLNWKRVNAKLPSEYVDEPETMPLEEAWELIQKKADDPSRKGSKKSAKAKKTGVALPPAPKRPKSSYLHFCAEKRPEVSSSVKTLGGVSKKLAQMWAEVSDEERQRFDELAAQSKAEYEELKKAWEAECKKIQGNTRSRGGQKASGDSSGKQLPPPPKRGKSAYLFFCEAHRPEVSKSTTKLGDISKELARMWAETTDRSEYEALATADKARYQIEKQAYDNQLLADSSTTDVNGAKNGVKVGKKVKASTPTTTIKIKKTPSKRPPSAYMLFCREMRDTVVDEQGNKLPFGETTKQLAQQWKNCDPSIRARFDALAAEEKDKLLQQSN